MALWFPLYEYLIVIIITRWFLTEAKPRMGEAAFNTCNLTLVY